MKNKIKNNKKIQRIIKHAKIEAGLLPKCLELAEKKLNEDRLRFQKLKKIFNKLTNECPKTDGIKIDEKN